ncbi:MAG: oxidoreductase [Sphingobacteriaceae bacterium]|jgi:predicted dehydrogenase|nr:oxidoreductase [Sphingobacteriaceae bacterium]
MEPIKTGILAYGMSGRLFHAPFVATNPGFELYAVTERNKKTATERYPDVKSYNSVDELLQDEAVELVIINTPNNTHYEFAKKALEAGKHILVEKPFATSSAEAKEVFDLGRQMGKKVMAYQNRRWDSDFQSLKNVIEGGELGKLIEVELRFDRYKREPGPKAFKETPVPGSGISFDLGPHLLDQAISLFGKPLKAFKITGTNRPGSKVDDYLSVHLIYPEGLNVYVAASLLCAEPLPSFVAHGVNGSYLKNRTDVQEAQLDKEILPTDEQYGIEPDGSEGKLTIVDESGRRSTEYLTALPANYSRLFDAVCKYIRDDEPFPVTEEDIDCQLEILESADA